MTAPSARELQAFFAIYVIWGSTYLAIREAVATIPPRLTGGVRHLLAGVVIYALCVWLRGRRVPISAIEWRSSLVVIAAAGLILLAVVLLNFDSSQRVTPTHQSTDADPRRLPEAAVIEASNSVVVRSST